MNDTDSVTLLAAALKLLTKEPDTTPVNITEEKPLRVRRRRESGRGDRHRRDGDRPVTEIVVEMTVLVAAAMIVEVNVVTVVTVAEMIVNLIVHVVTKTLVIRVKVSSLTLKTNRMWIASGQSTFSSIIVNTIYLDKC